MAVVALVEYAHLSIMHKCRKCIAIKPDVSWEGRKHIASTKMLESITICKISVETFFAT